MRKAVVEQIFVWIVLFAAFAGIFFMILDYAMVVKARENCATISNAAAREIAVSDPNDAQGDYEDVVIAKVNAVKGDYIATASTADLSCTYPGTTNSQIVFTSQLTLVNRFLADSTVSQSVGVYNEVDSADINCTLTLQQ